jgi:phosphoglycerate dehydrogenase-like enzyme
MIINCMPRSVLSKEEADLLRELSSEEIVDLEKMSDAESFYDEVEAIIPPFRYKAEDLQPMKNLKWVQSFSAGVNTHPLSYLKDNEILLTNTRGVHAPQMTDHIMGMILAFSRDFLPAIRHQKDRLWTYDFQLTELRGKELLIVGAGSIGQMLAKKAKAFEMRVVGLKRTPEELRDFDVVLPLDDMLKAMETADYIVILAPLTKETRGMVGEDAFRRMKKNAVLINLGRGPLVEEEALLSALKEKRIRGAGLDVFHREPLPEESPLWDMENVLLTPHIGGFSDGANRRAVELMAENIKRFRRGEKLLNIVDLGLGY